ncbi:MAG: penicillin-binding protein 2 [Bacteroidales bacterium]|nr:penicillin-binding protein 2 [Bacteroidales bacterium]
MNPLIYSNRKFIIGTIFCVIALIYVIKLFTIQVMDSSYKLSAESNVFRKVIDYPARGLVFDRNGKLLVSNESTYDVLVTPNRVEEFDTLDLCNILGITIETFRTEYKKAVKYARYKESVIFKQLTKRRYSNLQEKMYKFPGFNVQKRTARHYEYPYAAHVLGYIREADTALIAREPYYKPGDYVGVSGIEKSYEKQLRGVKGLKIYVVDVKNRIQGKYKDGKFDSTAVVGENVTSTLDIDLQVYGEKLMQNKVGAIVAIEPSSGEILALVSTPGYDPNLLIGSDMTANYMKLVRDRFRPMYNRAIMGCYPPGSTFKTINALIGLQEGVIKTNTSFPCNGGFSIGRHVVKCHHGGSLDLVSAIQHSCNAYFCHEFTKIIDDKKYKRADTAYSNWRRRVQSFGLGKKLGSDLSQEVNGIIYSKDYFNRFYGEGHWSAFTIISLSIGQGELSFSPLQICNACATIANRGHYFIPHIVKTIGKDQKVDERFYQPQETGIEDEYFETVIQGMYQVCEMGTGRSARVPGVKVCGKTGTAQTPHGKDHSIFEAFAPMENPKIAIAVYVENGGFGATYAAPIAGLMIEKYLNDTITRKDVEQRMFNANLMDLNAQMKN